MCRKLCFLTSFVLVLSVTLMGTARAELVGWWRLDDGTGTVAADSSASGNDGTIEGSPQPVVGQFGSALMFDATDDQIIVPTNATLDIETEITMMLWANPGPNLTADWRNLVGKSPTNVLNQNTFSYSIRTDPSGMLRFSLNLGGWQYVLGPTLEQDTWYHITGTYDGTQLILYVDGESAGTTQASGGINVTPDPVCIGNLVNAAGASQNEFWSGVIDDVMIHNRALTQEEVQRIMHFSTGGQLMLAETALFIMDEVDSGNIAPELEGSLLAKINAALAALDRGNPNDAKVAMNDLKALINQIEAQVNKKITPEVAAEIIDRTNAIIAALAD